MTVKKRHIPTIERTNFNFLGQTGCYRGKVRDTYTINHELLISVASDRISAFDVILPRQIPYKGQVLNEMALYFLEATRDIVPNWLVTSPHPNVSIGKQLEPIRLEVIVRGYLAGNAYRRYTEGKRWMCGNQLPDGLKENDKLPEPIITPTTKAAEGHDEDILPSMAMSRELVSRKDWPKIRDYAFKLFQRGTEMAAERGLILVDTKYEFGKDDHGKLYLIDEIHTPDSSRYFYADGYAERQAKGEKQKQLSKEFVREWLVERGFEGKEGQVVPEMNDEFITQVSDRYTELYSIMMGKKFEPGDITTMEAKILEVISLPSK